MLLYCNRTFWRTVLEHKGSVVFRRQSILTGLIIAGVAAGLQVLIDLDSKYAPELPHHYGMHALGAVVALAVVFRTNLGWQRYWEAMTQQHFMYSKWADAYSQFVAFATVTVAQNMAKGGEEADGKVKRVKNILLRMEKNFSLLSALAAHRLMHGDTQRMERRLELGMITNWSKHIVMRGALRIGPDITHATRLPEFRSDDSHGQTKILTTDSNDWDSAYVVKHVPSTEEMEVLANSTDRVGSVMYWIIQDLAAISKDIDIAPPIQSRMYQELSNGMLGFNNSLKIADVPFPFPYAQLLTLLLTVFSIFIPVYIVCFTKSMLASPILSFLLFQGFWGINEVAKELENPFGTDENDISLADFHARFMDMLNEVQAAREVNARPQVVAKQTDLKKYIEPTVVGQSRTASADGCDLTPQPPKDLSSIVVVPPEFVPPPLENSGIADSVNTPVPVMPLLQPGIMFRPEWHDAKQQKKAEDAMGNSPGRKLESGTKLESETPQLAAGLASTVNMVDQNLSMIGTRMEQHLAQLAKELTVISRLASDGRQQLLAMENNENVTRADNASATGQSCIGKAQQDISVHPNTDGNSNPQGVFSGKNNNGKYSGNSRNTT